MACAGFHPPAVLAKMASTIDEVSQGRFVLGLGSGWNRREFDAFGIPYDKRVSRFEEAFAIIGGLLRGERVTLDGTYHRADDVVLLPEPARQTPIMIGSNGRRMLSSPSPTPTRGTPGGRTTATRPKASRRCTSASASLHSPQRVRARRARRSRPSATTRASGRSQPPGLAAHIAELGEAGADEVIVVAEPHHGAKLCANSVHFCNQRV